MTNLDAHEQSAARRDQSAKARLAAAEGRDALARARDLVAIMRDEAADARALSPARAADAPALAPAQADAAARDRREAAQDREQAACERLHALVDRELLARELELSAIDPLTGARARAAGLAELDREVDRCRRTARPLVVAYVDVVGLKALNDSEGHLAGDELLERAVAFIRARVRSYDLIVRVGGDEFLCAMSDVTLPAARRRFAQVAADLAAAPGVGEIRTGFARLTDQESASELIARADGELIDGPHGLH